MTQTRKFFISGGVTDNCYRVGPHSSLSNKQSGHARSARLAGHKWLGRRVDTAWRVHHARAGAFTTNAKRNIFYDGGAVPGPITNSRNEEIS